MEPVQLHERHTATAGFCQSDRARDGEQRLPLSVVRARQSQSRVSRGRVAKVNAATDVDTAVLQQGSLDGIALAQPSGGSAGTGSDWCNDSLPRKLLPA